MKSFKVILHCSEALLQAKRSEVDAALETLGSSNGAEVSLVHSASETLLISADLVGFSRQESSAIRSGLRTTLGEILA